MSENNIPSGSTNDIPPSAPVKPVPMSSNISSNLKINLEPHTIKVDADIENNKFKTVTNEMPREVDNTTQVDNMQTAPKYQYGMKEPVIKETKEEKECSCGCPAHASSAAHASLVSPVPSPVVVSQVSCAAQIPPMPQEVPQNNPTPHATQSQMSVPTPAAAAYTPNPIVSQYAPPASKTSSSTTPVSPTSLPPQPPIKPSVYPSSHVEPPFPRTIENKPGFSLSTFVASICVCSLISAGLVYGITSSTPKISQATKTVIPAITQQENTENEKTLATSVAEIARPSVVCIYSYTQPQSNALSLFFNGRSGSGSGTQDGVDSSSPVLSGLGSGVIVSRDGYIITNYHVINGAAKIQVSVDGKDSYEGTIVGSDPQSDIAVVKIEGNDFPAIEVANSDELRVGDWTMAIGSPYGYEETCTTGIISALSRSTAMQSNDGTTTYYPNLVQTDAAINTGNSGGALVDASGKLIGINTLISSTTGDSSGIGFAIPSNYATAIANKIISGGAVNHGSLGVMVSNNEDKQGAVVAQVIKDGAADLAGLKAGDVIIKIGGKDVEMADEVVYAVKERFEGDEIEIVYVRDGKETTTKAVLKKAEEIVANNNTKKIVPNIKNNGNGNSGSGNSNSDIQDLLDQFLNGR